MNEKNSFWEETGKALSSLASRNNFIGPKFKSDIITFLDRHGYERSLGSVSKITHPNLPKMTKTAKQALARYVIEDTKDEVSVKKLLFSFLLI